MCDLPNIAGRYAMRGLYLDADEKEICARLPGGDNVKYVMVMCAVLLFSALLAQSDISITGSRGQNLELSVSGIKPDGVRPCLILAPGRGYHKDLPILTDLAQQAETAGYVTIRFNWNYHTTGGEPSVAVVNEQADLFDVIDYAKAMGGVDSTKIVIAGKSLGSVVAWWVFQKSPSLAGVLLLTPVMATEQMGETYYHHLPQETRPVSLIVGAQDTDNCPLPVLYEFLGAQKVSVPVMIVPGDHGLNVGPWDDASWQERNTANIHAANSAAVIWLKTYVQP